MKKGGEGVEEEVKVVDDIVELSELRMAIEELSLVKHDEKQPLPTLPFLTVSNLILQVLDKIGPTMAVLRHDVHRNIQRLEDLYITDTSIYSSLVEILKKEVNEGSTRKSESCSKAILWLTRTMDFCVMLLEKLEKDSASTLAEVVEEAYKNTLKPWHGWISSAAYKVAMKLIPDRKIFISVLIGKGQDTKMLSGDVQAFISSIQPLLGDIHGHLRDFQLERLKSI